MAGDGEVGRHQDAAALVQRRAGLLAEHFAELRGPDARPPQHRLGRDALFAGRRL